MQDHGRQHVDPLGQVQNTSVPGNADERTAYLLYYLLTHKDFVKLSELADQLYVSTQTLSVVIKRVEAMLEYYHIQIQRKPYYGIRAEGSEFDKHPAPPPGPSDRSLAAEPGHLCLSQFAAGGAGIRHRADAGQCGRDLLPQGVRRRTGHLQHPLRR
ncbi:helix-turn-helix domain-containing protein [Faecalibacterium sp. An121]|uniref:helix-turn-helix domain-containing protein n=1 Tax=Faecalibacterium sp. An121 TaxID=1965550 RepID=UPI00406C2052